MAPKLAPVKDTLTVKLATEYCYESRIRKKCKDRKVKPVFLIGVVEVSFIWELGHKSA